MKGGTCRLGGGLLVAAGLTGIIGGATHGVQPPTLDAYAALDHGIWQLSHASIAAAGAVYAMAALFLARYFSGGAGEGWALVGAASLLLAGAAYLGIGVLETTGFNALLAAHAAGDAVAAEHAFRAVMAIMSSLSASGGYLITVALISFGVGMLARTDWPRGLAWAGLAIGFGLLAVRLFGIPLPNAAGPLAFYLHNGWLAAAGYVLYRMGSVASPAPHATAPGGRVTAG